MALISKKIAKKILNCYKQIEKSKHKKSKKELKSIMIGFYDYLNEKPTNYKIKTIKKELVFEIYNQYKVISKAKKSKNKDNFWEQQAIMGKLNVKAIKQLFKKKLEKKYKFKK